MTYLNKSLFSWNDRDTFSIGQSLESVMVFGATGSGKSSCVNSHFAKCYLQNYYAGLILSVKDEKEKWITYCKETHRLDDLILVTADAKNCGFNFLEYLNSAPTSIPIAQNIARKLHLAINAGIDDGNGSQDKAFWDSSLLQLLTCTIELLQTTRSQLRIYDIHRLIQDTPRNYDDLSNPKWTDSSACFQLLKQASTILKSLIPTPEVNEKIRRFKILEYFFLRQWVNLSEKTRSIVEQYFMAFADRLLSSPLFSLFCDKSDITPELLNQGKIILVDLPVVKFGDIGLYANTIWKLAFQHFVTTRDINKNTKPVFLNVDEAHIMLADLEEDARFVSVSREYRCANLILTQNLTNFIHTNGGDAKAKTAVESFLSNFGTKIFLGNTDPNTNEFASNLIGKDITWRNNQNVSIGENFSSSHGSSEQTDYIIQPNTFSKLATPGEVPFVSEAIVHRQGRSFRSNGENYLTTAFYRDDIKKQKFPS